MKLFFSCLCLLTVFTSTALAERNRQFVCTDPAGSENETFFFDIHTSGTRLVDLRAEGPNGFETPISDVAQFKYTSEENSSSIYIWHQAPGIGGIGFILDVTGSERVSGVLKGTYAQIFLGENFEKIITYKENIRCRRMI